MKSSNTSWTQFLVVMARPGETNAGFDLCHHVRGTWPGVIWFGNHGLRYQEKRRTFDGYDLLILPLSFLLLTITVFTAVHNPEQQVVWHL